MVQVHIPSSLYEAIPHSLFANPEIRPTVSLVICIQGKVLLLNSKHAHDEGLYDWWTLPQEGIKHSDGNLIGTMRRNMQEELGYLPPDVSFFKARTLGNMKNSLPRLRRRAGVQMKLIRFVGVKMPQFQITLNEKENQAYRFVSSWSELDEAMEQVALYRVRKYEHVCGAILHACECGLLPWEIPRGLAFQSSIH